MVQTVSFYWDALVTVLSTEQVLFLLRPSGDIMFARLSSAGAVKQISGARKPLSIGHKTDRI